jgi:hypothetical protein
MIRRTLRFGPKWMNAAAQLVPSSARSTRALFVVIALPVRMRQNIDAFADALRANRFLVVLVLGLSLAFGPIGVSESFPKLEALSHLPRWGDENWP